MHAHINVGLREHYRFWIRIQKITIFGILVCFDLKLAHTNFWKATPTQKKVINTFMFTLLTRSLMGSHVFDCFNQEIG